MMVPVGGLIVLRTPESSTSVRMSRT